ncbi:hypothetical protein HAX54_039246 [Datura stramonium]|uniref:Uncharacterized protein n=1 Tax=Datura stramonium TaxID=4076 RepID=A0ABS8VLP9_DATST|nr:hypothetical protein [Datura stramonium]
MSEKLNNTTLVLVYFVVVVMLVGDDHYANAAKNAQVVNVYKSLLPGSSNSQKSFSQSLPKGISIPPSAPSKAWKSNQYLKGHEEIIILKVSPTVHAWFTS